VDHPVEAELPAFLGTEDPRDALSLERLDLVRSDRSSTAAIHEDRSTSALPQPVHQVPEELHVAALIGRDRHRVHVLLDRSLHEFVHRTVVSQVDHLGALGLQEPAHDVDGGVVPIEQRSRRQHADGRVRTRR
jgi:hypothetical protein